MATENKNSARNYEKGVIAGVLVGAFLSVAIQLVYDGARAPAAPAATTSCEPSPAAAKILPPAP